MSLLPNEKKQMGLSCRFNSWDTVHYCQTTVKNFPRKFFFRHLTDTHTWPLHVMLAFHSVTAGFWEGVFYEAQVKVVGFLWSSRESPRASGLLLCIGQASLFPDTRVQESALLSLSLSLSFNFKKFTYSLVALGVHCCAWAFSSCGKWGLLELWRVGFSLRWPVV